MAIDKKNILKGALRAGASVGTLGMSEIIPTGIRGFKNLTNTLGSKISAPVVNSEQKAGIMADVARKAILKKREAVDMTTPRVRSGQIEKPKTSMPLNLPTSMPVKKQKPDNKVRGLGWGK